MMSPGRTGLSAGVSTAKCTSRPSRARPVIRAVRLSLRPSPAATSNSTVCPIRALIALQRDRLLQLDQPLVPFLHNGFR